MIFRSEPENVNRQAGDWLARLHADDRTAEDEAAFRRWLTADPLHRDAFSRASTVWDAVGGLRDDTVSEAPVPALATARMSRRMVLAGGAAAIVAGGTMLGWREANAGVYTTGIGEQRRLVLADGSRVMLDTNTQVRFRARADVRMLALRTGRIDVEIARDPRPFVVDMGDRRATTRAGRLDLRRDDRGAAVTAIQGSVRIDAPGAPVSIPPGSRIAMQAGHADRLDRPDLDDLVAWQSGRLAFRDDTLADAAAEMNRYTPHTLIVADPRAAAMRLSGVYRVGDPEAFARSVAILLPVRVTSDGETIRVSASSKK
ncbi:FecR family protein [Sphingomonas sp. RS6]